nr:Cap [Trichosanthes kirilowii CRESS virus]
MRYGRRRRRTRRPFFRRRKTYKIAKRAAKSVLWKQSETKYYDYTWSSANITISDVIEILQYIAKGTARSNRIGEKIKLIGFRYKYTIQGFNPNDHIRFMFALPKNHEITTTASVWPNVNSPVSTDVMRVMRDTDCIIDSDTNTQRTYKGKINFKGGRLITYSPGTGVMDKPLVAYFTSNHGLLNYPKLWGFVRVYYKDI